MKKNILFTGIIPLFCALIFSGCTIPPFPYGYVRPDSTATRRFDFDIDSLKKAYPGADAVYLGVKTIVETRDYFFGRWLYVSSIDNIEFIMSERYVVLNPQADDVANFEFSSYSGWLGEADIVVHTPGKPPAFYNEDRLERIVTPTGETRWKFAIPGVATGTVIDLAVQAEITSRPFKRQFSLGPRLNIPCRYYEVDFFMDGGYSVYKRPVSAEQPILLPQVVNEYGQELRHFADSNIAAVAYEPYMPYPDEFHDPYQFIITTSDRPDELDDDDIENAWESIAKRIKRLSIESTGFFSFNRNGVPELADALRSTTAENKLRRMQAVLHYFQTNFKVVMPGDDKFGKNADDIVISKVGTPYSLTMAMKDVLDELDIPAEYYVIRRTSSGYFDKRYALLWEFDIPCLRATVADSTYYLFPYIAYLPPNVFPDYIIGQRALRVTGNDDSLFTSIPDAGAQQNISSISADLTIALDGTVSISEKRIYSGTHKKTIADAVQLLNDEERKRYIKKLIGYDEGEVTVKTHDISGLNSPTAAVTVTMEYSIDNLVSFAGGTVALDLHKLYPNSTENIRKEDASRRRSPVKIYQRDSVGWALTITYPASWNVGQPGRNEHISTTAGEAYVKVMQDSGNIRCEAARTLIPAYLPAKKSDSLYALFDIATVGFPVVSFTKN